MGLYSQYKKLFNCIIVVLPAVFLPYLIFSQPSYTWSRDKKNNVSSALTKSSEPFHDSGYNPSPAVLPEEETVSAFFFHTANRYLQHPQRFLYTDFYFLVLLFFNTGLIFNALFSSIKKINKSTPEIALHIGGHAPPAIFRNNIGSGHMFYIRKLCLQ